METPEQSGKVSIAIDGVIPILLLKFGELDHLEDFLKNGNLRVSSIQELRKDPKNKGGDYRIDPCEGASTYFSRGPGNAQLIPVGRKDAEPIKMPFLNFNLWEKFEFVLGHISSFYAITNKSFLKNELVPIDSQMRKFGPYVMIIKSFNEFIKRIENAIDDHIHANALYGFVKYFDEDEFDDKLSLFDKRSRFSYQKEFRIYFDTKKTDHMFINLGNLESIAMIIPSEAAESIQATLDMEKMNCNIRCPILKD